MYIDHLNLCYYIFEMDLQWQSASLYCRALDSRAHLVIVNSQEEQRELSQGLSHNPSKYTNQMPLRDVEIDHPTANKRIRC